MKEYLIPFVLLIILIVTLLISYNRNDLTESFSNNDKYLYPIKGLQSICQKEGLNPSFMPKACYVDGNLNSYANCKCEDDSGNCKICYDTIKKDSNNSSVIYNAGSFS